MVKKKPDNTASPEVETQVYFSPEVGPVEASSNAEAVEKIEAIKAKDSEVGDGSD